MQEVVLDFLIVLMGILGMLFGAAVLWTLPSMIQVVPLVFAGVFAGRPGPMEQLVDTVRTVGMMLNISMTLAALKYGASAVEVYKEEVMAPRPSLRITEETPRWTSVHRVQRLLLPLPLCIRQRCRPMCNVCAATGHR